MPRPNLVHVRLAIIVPLDLAFRFPVLLERTNPKQGKWLV